MPNLRESCSHEMCTCSGAADGGQRVSSPLRPDCGSSLIPTIILRNSSPLPHVA